MKKKIALVGGIIAVIELTVLASTVFIFKNDSFLASVISSDIVSLTNDQRVADTDAPLTISPLLTEAAQDKANDMAAKGYFSHVTPEGYSPWYWLDKVGYSYTHAGENLAVNFTESQDVVTAWMNSPAHRANIVKGVYTQIGVGVASGTYQGRSAIFVVQFFGTPANASSTATSTPL